MQWEMANIPQKVVGEKKKERENLILTKFKKEDGEKKE